MRWATLLICCLGLSCHALFPYTSGGDAAKDGPKLEAGRADAGRDRGRFDGRTDRKRVDASGLDAVKLDVRKPDAAKPDVKKPDAANKSDGKKPDGIPVACRSWGNWACTTSTTVCVGSCLCRAKCGTSSHPLLVCNQNPFGSLAQCTIQYSPGASPKQCPDFALTTTGCPVCLTAFNLCY